MSLSMDRRGSLSTIRARRGGSFRIVEDTTYVYSDGNAAKWTPEKVRKRCRTDVDRLVQDRDAFVLRNQGLLLKSLQKNGLEEANKGELRT
jgi:hypothetical protein